MLRCGMQRAVQIRDIRLFAGQKAVRIS